MTGGEGARGVELTVTRKGVPESGMPTTDLGGPEADGLVEERRGEVIVDEGGGGTLDILWVYVWRPRPRLGSRLCSS